MKSKKWLCLFEGIVLTTIFLCGGTAIADECSEVLRHGIYDYFRESKENSSASAAKHEICTSYSKYKSDKVGATISASYGAGSGSGSYTSDEIEKLGSAMCDASASSSDSNALLNSVSRIISPQAVALYGQCKKMRSVGLIYDTSYTDDDEGTKVITVSVSYTSEMRKTASPAKTGIIIAPSGSFDCRGSLVDMPIGGKFESNYSMSCTRKIENIPVQVGAKYYFAPPSQITVTTEAGPVNFSFNGINATAPPANPPIGSILLFAGVTPPIGWMVCDGTSLDRASNPVLFSVIKDTYGAANGNSFNLPNFQGRVAVGAGKNPKLSVDRQLGSLGGEEFHTILIDEMPSHSHSGTTKQANAMSYRVVLSAGFTTFPNHVNGFSGGPHPDPDPNNDQFPGAAHTHDFTTNIKGGNKSFDKMPPYTAINYIIRVR